MFKIKEFRGYCIGVKYYISKVKNTISVQKATNLLGSDEKLYIKKLSDKILEFLFITKGRHKRESKNKKQESRNKTV